MLADFYSSCRTASNYLVQSAKFSVRVVLYLLVFAVLHQHASAEMTVAQLDQARDALPETWSHSFSTDPVSAGSFRLTQRTGKVSHQPDPTAEDFGYRMTLFGVNRPNQNSFSLMDLGCRYSPMGNFDAVVGYHDLRIKASENASVVFGVEYTDKAESIQLRVMYRGRGDRSTSLVGQLHRQKFPQRPEQTGKSREANSTSGSFRIARQGSVIVLMHQDDQGDFEVIDQHPLPESQTSPRIFLRVTSQNRGAVGVIWTGMSIAAESFDQAPAFSHGVAKPSAGVFDSLNVR